MTIAVAAEVCTPDATAGATSIALAVTCSAGDCLHIAVTHGASDTVSMAATPLTNTGSAITFSSALDNIDDTTNHQRIVHYYANNVPAQTTTITASFTGSATYRGIKIKRITGSSGYDSVASAAHAGQIQVTPTTSTDAVSSGNTSALSAQPALISGFSIATAVARTTAVGTGFTNDQTTAWQFGSGINMSASESKRVTSTSALAATFTAASNDSQSTVAAVFLETSVAGPTLLGQACL